MFWKEKAHQIHTVSLVVASSWEDSVRTREKNDRTESLEWERRLQFMIVIMIMIIKSISVNETLHACVKGKVH